MHRAFWIFVTLSLAGNVAAQDDPYAHERVVLRGMLEQVEGALNAHDLTELMPLLMPEVVITYHNGEVTRGPEEARAYFERMLIGDEAVVSDYQTTAAVDAPAVFYGDVAVAYGTAKEVYELAEGIAFTLDANWSTTLLKQDGQWKVAAIHFSSNLFDNPLLDTTERLTWTGALVALAAGLVLGLVLGRRRRA